MKKFFILILLILPLSVYSQAVVIDATRQASDTAIGSEEKAEEEVQKTTLEKIQEFSQKTQAIMDSVNIYMNMTTSYVQSAKQLYQAGEALYKAIENYDRYVDYIKNSVYLTPQEKLSYINHMYQKILNIKDLIEKMKDVTGANSKGLSQEERAQKEGKMKDGERIRIITKYLSYIMMEISNIDALYFNAVNKERYKIYNDMLNEYSTNAMFFNF